MVGSVPTAAERGGDFSQLAVTTAGAVVRPAERRAFSRQRDSLRRCNQLRVGDGLLQYFPSPIYPGIVQNYRFVITDPSGSRSVGVRFNAPLNNKDRLNFNFQRQNGEFELPPAFRLSRYQLQLGPQLSSGWSHSFAPRLNNSATFSLSRSVSQGTPFFANGAEHRRRTGHCREPRRSPSITDRPSLSFTNFSGLSDGTPSLEPQPDRLHLGDPSLTWSGANTTSRSASPSTACSRTAEITQNARGSFSFSGIADQRAGRRGAAREGHRLRFRRLSAGTAADPPRCASATNNYFRSWSTSAYAQDDFRVSAGLPSTSVCATSTSRLTPSCAATWRTST